MAYNTKKHHAPRVQKYLVFFLYLFVVFFFNTTLQDQALAQDTTGSGFSVNNISINAVSENAFKAKEIAVSTGKKQAMRILARRLKVKKLTGTKLNNAIRDLSLSNERFGDKSYEATLSVRFLPSTFPNTSVSATEAQQEAQAQTASTLGVQKPTKIEKATAVPIKPAMETSTPTTGKTKGILVLPILKSDSGFLLWIDKNTWLSSWNTKDTTKHHLVVPLGDLGDIQAITANQAIHLEAPALAKIFKKYHATEGLLSLARWQKSSQGKVTGLIVDNQLIKNGKVIKQFTSQLTRNPQDTLASFTHLMVRRVIADLEDNASAQARQQTQGTMDTQAITVTVPIQSLGQWVYMKRQLVGTPTVTSVKVVRLTTAEAIVAITYSKDIDALKQGLGTYALLLSQVPEKGWFLTR